jgi:hypothetical protein
VTRVILVLLMVFVSTPAMAQPARDPRLPPPIELGPNDFGDVRSFVWGVSPGDIRQFEQAMFFEQLDDAHFYLDYITGIRTLIAYEFFEDKLWRATLDFQVRYPEAPKALDDFLKFQTMVEEKYGPAQVEFKWNNDMYKPYQHRWGMFTGAIFKLWPSGATSAQTPF